MQSPRNPEIISFGFNRHRVAQGPLDRHINVGDAAQVRGWACELGVTVRAVHRAAAAVGTSLSAVTAYLAHRGPKARDRGSA
jgi:hypothetical protein